MARAPYYDALRSMAKRLLEERRLLVMFVGDEATLVTPDEALPLGRMTAEDNFRSSRSSARGPDVARHKGRARADSGRLTRPHYFAPPET